MTTSLTNTHLSDRMIWSYAKLRGYKMGEDIDWIVEGDDCIIGCKTDVSKDIMNHYNDFGFSTTLEYKGPFIGSSFCKIRFEEYRNEIVGFRRLDHAIDKLGWTKNFIQHGRSQAARNYFYSKLLSFYHMFRHSQAVRLLVMTVLPLLGSCKMIGRDVN